MLTLLAWAFAQPPNAVSDVKAVAVSYQGAPGCLSKADGSVWCWSRRRVELDGPPAGPLVVEGHEATDLLRLGPQVCMENSEGVDCLPDGPAFHQEGILGVTGGPSWRCIHLGDGTVECEGQNLNGEIGRSPMRRGLPGGVKQGSWAPIEGAVGVRSLTETCAVLEGGELLCWGAHALRPVQKDVSDVAAYVDAVKPRIVPGLTDVLEAVVAFDKGCVAVKNAPVRCFLRKAPEEPPREVALEVEAVEVDAGLGGFVFRTASGELWTWDGSDGSGAQRVPGIEDAVSVSAVATHACAVTASGHARCWGANEGGQRGDGTVESPPEPSWVIDHRPELAPAPAAGGMGCTATRTSRKSCAHAGPKCVMESPPGYWSFGGGGARCDQACWKRLDEELRQRAIPACLCSCGPEYEAALKAQQIRRDQPPRP